MPDKTAETLVIAPLYKNAALVEGLVGSLLTSKADFAALPGRVLFVNDSPDDKALAAALEQELPRLDGQIPYELWVNPENLGFIGACNRGMERARDEGRDVILLNSDTLLTPGALTEMAAVTKLDPMIGFVSPRSNNATICNSPYPDRFRALDFDDAVTAHRTIEKHLPRITYVPTDVGFCMLIRHAMLTEFGLFDPIYGGGYNEETDLVLRCNRRGYRAVMANHAFVFHMGAQSFSLSEVPPYERERKNRRILLSRYPAYERAVERYFDGAEFHAQNLLGGLVPDKDGRRRVLFHAPFLHDTYNGTFEMTVRTVTAFVKAFADRYACSIACPEDGYLFHGLDKVQGLEWLNGTETQAAPFYAALRLSQPFAPRDLVDLPMLAPITGFVMHDTIALDCIELDEQNLTRVWEQMVQTTAMLAYVSDFSRSQFGRRFPVPDHVAEATALLSTDASEYAPKAPATGSGDAILVIGNHYAHKHAVEMVDAIHALAPERRVVLLGVEVPARPNLASYRAGDLDQDLIERLYAEAAVVLFPTHYEGFGLPVMQTLARRRPLICRPLPPFQEIAARTPLSDNIHFHDSTEAMARAAIASPRWTDRLVSGHAPVQTWATVAGALVEGFERAEAQIDFAALRRRMAAVAALQAESSQVEATSARKIQRLAPKAPGELSPGLLIRRVAGRQMNILFWKLARVPAGRLTRLGDAARDAGDFEIAADAYGQALRRNAKLDHIWVQYGHALKETGQRSAAEAAYRQAIALTPDKADTHLQLGHVLKIQNKLLEAKDAFERALSLDPELADAATEIAKLSELGAGHMRKAILMARDLVKNAPPGAVLGCVIAQGGLVVGAAASAGEGAVEQALSEAGSKTRGATAYLTKDPSSEGALRLAKSAIERAVIACVGDADAEPALAAAGIVVSRGFLAPEARISLHYAFEDQQSVTS